MQNGLMGLLYVSKLPDVPEYQILKFVNDAKHYLIILFLQTLGETIHNTDKFATRL